MMNFKKKILNQLDDQTKDRLYILFKKYQKTSYSQEGEDLILNRLFEKINKGFYIDIGAHHPIRFSNTYFFYRKGWSGINIDARPGSMLLFNRLRKRDINIETAVSDSETELTYYMFNDTALNTFDRERAEVIIKETNYKLTSKKIIKTSRLENILDHNVTLKQSIDFMNIDVEGLDLKVLKSNNWNKYKPKYILVESLEKDSSDIYKDPISLFLSNSGYRPFACTFNTLFYKLK